MSEIHESKINALKEMYHGGSHCNASKTHLQQREKVSKREIN